MALLERLLEPRYKTTHGQEPELVVRRATLLFGYAIMVGGGE